MINYPLELAIKSPRCNLCNKLRTTGIKDHFMKEHPILMIYHIIKMSENIIKKYGLRNAE